MDRARRKQAEIHGGGRSRVDLQKVEAVGCLPPDRMLALDEALTLLARHDPVAGQLVHLRSFAGLSAEEAGEAVGVSRATAYRHLTFARAWLGAQFTQGGPDGG